MTKALQDPSEPPGSPADRPERTTTGYLAAPAGSPRAVIVVLHAWWGLTPAISAVCDDLATLGYVGVAPDLYRGEVATTAEEAAGLRARKRSIPMWRQIVVEINRASSRFEVAPVGQIGFSMGGHWALWLAKRSRPEIPPITATSVFYATRAGDFTASTSAFQFHLAETDPFVTEAGIARQLRQLRVARCDVDVHRYVGTGHWFFERDRPEAYDQAASDLAWRRTVDFLDRHFPAGHRFARESEEPR
jgi:carboxymethylenebutenolidase